MSCARPIGATERYMPRDRSVLARPLHRSQATTNILGPGDRPDGFRRVVVAEAESLTI